MKKRLKKHKRKIITILIILLVVCIVFAPLLLKEIPFFDESVSKLNLILTVSQILSALFVIVGTVIAVWQYYLSSKSNIIKLDTDRVQKAIDLSRYYKDEILHPYSSLKYVYIKAGITNILAKEKTKMKEFDDYELHEIFADNELTKLKEKFNSIEYVRAIIELNQRYDFGMQLCKKFENEDDLEKITEEDKSNIIKCFNAKFCTPVMNNIEHFAMYFTHNVADESVIYQSLAPTYLEMCRFFYYNIAICSKSGQTKLYRNLKNLYEIWNKRTEEARRQIREHEVAEGTIVGSIN